MKCAVSVIVPSRDRVPLLHHMLTSLYAMASRPDQVEVVVRCDNDDNDTIQYLRTQQKSFIVGPRLEGYATLGVLVNEAARLSHADLVIVVNDDAEFETAGWDVKLLDAAAQFPDGIFDLGVETVMNNDNFVFPCTSRRMVDLIGIHEDRLVYNDIWLRDVMAHFGRAVRVPGVTIRHNWRGMTEDQQQAIQRLVQASFYEALYGQCVREAREKIDQEMRRFE